MASGQSGHITKKIFMKCEVESKQTHTPIEILVARKQAIRMASKLCSQCLGGQWGNTILRDDNLIVLCGERRLSPSDRQGFTIVVTPGTNATFYTLDS